MYQSLKKKKNEFFYPIHRFKKQKFFKKRKPFIPLLSFILILSFFFISFVTPLVFKSNPQNSILQKKYTPQNPEYPNFLYRLFQEKSQKNFLIEKYSHANYDGYYKQLEFQRYAIQKGDTLINIAQRFDINLDTIVSYNQIQHARSLKIKSELLIPNINGILHVVQKGETLLSLLKKYEKYQVRLKDIIYVNDMINSVIRPKENLFVPGARLEKSKLLKKIGEWSIFTPPIHGKLTSKVGLRVHPIIKKRILHTGVDIKAKYGEPVRASRRGRVKFTGKKGGYGLLVIINHGKGLSTYYGHLSKILVKKGKWIQRGQIIGQVGSTGLSTGPHLHFEVRKNGKPQKILKQYKGLKGRVGGKWTFH